MAAAMRAIKETAVFGKPFVEKSALIGTLSLPHEFYDEMESFSRRDFEVFQQVGGSFELAGRRLGCSP